MSLPLFVLWGMTNNGKDVSGDKIAFVAVFSLFFLIGLCGVVTGIRTLLGISRSPPWPASPMLSGAALPLPLKSERLASGYYRLSPEASHRATFLIMLVMALFCNGITWTLIIGTSSEASDDKTPLWFLLIFVAVGFGLLLLVSAVHLFLARVMVGETHLEINATAVTPGQSVKIRVYQPGRFAIESLSVDLVCREKATYSVGSDTTTTKTEIVHDIPVCFLTNLHAQDKQTLAYRSFNIPEYAMLSFKSTNNEIAWLFQVKLTLPGRPDVRQMFPIRIVSMAILQAERNTRA